MSFNNFFGNDPFFNSGNSVFDNDPFFNPQLRKRNHSQRYNGNQIEPAGGHNGGNSQSLATTVPQASGDPFFNQMMMMHHQMNQSMANHFQGFHNNSMFFADGNRGSNSTFDSGDLAISVKPDHYELELRIKNLHKTSLDFHVDPDSRVVHISGSISHHVSQNGFTSTSQESFSKSATLPFISETAVINDADCVISYDGELLLIKIPVDFQKMQGSTDKIEYVEGRIEEL